MMQVATIFELDHLNEGYLIFVYNYLFIAYTLCSFNVLRVNNVRQVIYILQF